MFGDHLSKDPFMQYLQPFLTSTVNEQLQCFKAQLLFEDKCIVLAEKSKPDSKVSMKWLKAQLAKVFKDKTEAMTNSCLRMYRDSRK